MKRISLFITIAAILLFISGAAIAQKTEVKYSLAVYHYNLEYVAGDTKIENKIIVGSLDPMLDFFIDHPDWGADFEMQGYMVVETAKRYPEIFKKLERLVNSGQVSLMSFHYSDQLFLAYPAHDMHMSDMLNKKVFAELGVTPGGAVFAQEGQFGEGMAKFMADHGFSTLILPKNLYRHAHKDVTDAAPYYELNGVDVLLGGRGVNYEDENTIVRVDWSYMNDAELLPTDATPYSETFGYKAEAVEKYRQRLQKMADQGYTIGTIEQYMEAVKAAGVQPDKLKPMIDGVWQPIDTQNIFRWMGNYLGQHERDNEILTRNVTVRHQLLAVEVLVDYLERKGNDVSQMREQILEAWRNQAHAEVSDSTGWTPFPIEIEYVEKYSAAVSEIIRDISLKAGAITDAGTLGVNTADGSVVEYATFPIEAAARILEEVDCPVALEITGKMKKEEHRCVQWLDNVVKLEMHVRTTNSTQNNMRISFPRAVDYLLFSPSLWEEHYVKYDVSEFDPEDNEFYIPCSNGLIALEDDLFLIKNTSTIHVAYRFAFDEKEISLDLNRLPSKTYYWELYFFRGTPEEAVEYANSINVTPYIKLDGKNFFE